jgi:hypothetical protein
MGRKFGVESKLKMSNMNLLKSTQFIEQVIPNSLDMNPKHPMVSEVNALSGSALKTSGVWKHLADNLGKVIWYFGSSSKDVEAKHSQAEIPAEESLKDLTDIMSAQDSY